MSSGVGITTKGERELALRFDTFPTRAREKLKERIEPLTDALLLRIQGATPYATGKLRGQETSRIFADQPDRVAGYVSIAGQSQNDFAKAATLEYGTDKVRQRLEKGGLAARLGSGRLAERVTKPAHVAAFRYLRKPFEEMEPEIRAALEEAIAEVAAEGA